MKPYHSLRNITIYHGDCLSVMKTMEDNSIDSIVTDPPYGLSKEPDIAKVLLCWLNEDNYDHSSGGFMGKDWDSFVPGPSIWKECLRVLKPGGHLLTFTGTRTQDLIGISLRLGGFEIRDTIAWCFGSGFPKSLDIRKAIDKVVGGKREIVSEQPAYRIGGQGRYNGHSEGAVAKVSIPATSEAQEWDGWGTGLKPAIEPIILCRKPISEKTIVANVLRWGTGAININRCRVENGEVTDSWSMNGRWPANLILDNSEKVRELFPETGNGARPNLIGKQQAGVANGKGIYGKYKGRLRTLSPDDSGSAARFFKQIPCLIYQAKASKTERNEGLEGMEIKYKAGAEFRPNHMEKAENGESGNPYGRWDKVENNHPTVKPLALMRYLIRLITPPDGTVLDPFLGSGTTLKAAQKEFFKGIGIELEEEYCQIAVGRLRELQPSLFSIGI